MAPSIGSGERCQEVPTRVDDEPLHAEAAIDRDIRDVGRTSTW
jgi:hypothetical protein